MKKRLLQITIFSILGISVILSFYDSWQVQLLSIILFKLFLISGCIYLFFDKENLLPKRTKNKRVTRIIYLGARTLIVFLVIGMIYYNFSLVKDLQGLQSPGYIKQVKGKVTNVDKQFLFFFMRQTVYFKGYNRGFDTYYSNYKTNDFYQVKILPESGIIIEKEKMSD